MLRFRLLLLLVCSCVFSAPALFAGDDWLPVDPADLKMASDPNAPGADAVILYREEIYNDILKYQSFYFRVKILTEKGKDRWSNVEVPYLKEDLAKVTDIHARTIHADGTIIPFEGQGFDKLAVREHDTKVFVRAFALPQVEVGSIIEYKYTLRWDDEFAGAQWDVQLDVYQRKASFQYYPYNFARQSLTVYNSETGEIFDNVNYVPFLPSAYPKVELKRVHVDQTLASLTVENVPAIQKEEYMPPMDQLAYRVRFFYTAGNTAADGTDEFWKLSAKAWNKSAEKFIEHSGNVGGTLDKILAPTDTADQKSRKIYAYVQSLENLSYGRQHTNEEGRGDQLPKSAGDALEQKRGSASDLTRLYVAFARAAGLHAYLMRVSTRDRWLFQKAILDRKQFNSEIAIVEIDGKEVYLDPGTKFCPYGILDWMKTLVTGQRENASGKVEFATTPDASYKDTQIKHIADMKLSDTGEIEGKITVGFFGQDAIKHRQAVLKADEQQRKKDLEDELASELPEGSKISLENVWNQDDIEKPLIVRFDVSVMSFATPTGKRLLIPATLFHTEDTKAFLHPNRTQVVYFEYPYMTIDEVTLHLPDGVKLGDLPKETKEQKETLAYVLSAKSGPQTVKFHRELLVGDFVIPVKSYPALQSFYESVRNADEQQVVFEVAGATQAQSVEGK